MFQTKVHEVYMHMVQNITVITIKGPPGIGKTEVGCPVACRVECNDADVPSAIVFVAAHRDPRQTNPLASALPRIKNHLNGHSV